jgi:hypothetical protein
MITIQNLFDIMSNKITNEMGKSIIRKNCPPNIADKICNAIDSNEKAEIIQRINEWQEQQNRQQQAIQAFLPQYFNR